MEIYFVFLGRTLEGLRSINKIEGDLRIHAYLIQNFEGLNNLEIINGDLEIDSSSLKLLKGFDKLKVIGGDLKINVNPNLISSNDVLNFINQLVELGGKAVYNELIELN